MNDEHHLSAKAIADYEMLAAMMTSLREREPTECSMPFHLGRADDGANVHMQLVSGAWNVGFTR